MWWKRNRYKRRLPVLFDGLCHHSQRYSNHCPLPKILVLGRHSVDKKLPDYQHGWQRLCWLRFRHNQQLPNIRAALSSCTVLSLCRKIQLHPTHSLPIFAYNLHRRFPGKPEPSDLMWGYQGKAVFEKVLIFLNGVSQWASANICYIKMKLYSYMWSLIRCLSRLKLLSSQPPDE